MTARTADAGTRALAIARAGVDGLVVFGVAPDAKTIGVARSRNAKDFYRRW